MELIVLLHYLESNLSSSSSIFSKSPMLWIYFFFLPKDIPASKQIGKRNNVLHKWRLAEFVDLGISYREYCIFSFLIGLAIVLLASLPHNCLATNSPLQLLPKQSFSRVHFNAQAVNSWEHEWVLGYSSGPSHLVRSLWKTSLCNFKARISRKWENCIPFLRWFVAECFWSVEDNNKLLLNAYFEVGTALRTGIRKTKISCLREARRPRI